MEARYLKDKLTIALSAPVFLDSDNLLELRSVLTHVNSSDCVVLLLTDGVFTRPWCVLEVCQAIQGTPPNLLELCAFLPVASFRPSQVMKSES